MAGAVTGVQVLQLLLLLLADVLLVAAGVVTQDRALRLGFFGVAVFVAAVAAAPVAAAVT